MTLDELIEHLLQLREQCPAAGSAIVYSVPRLTYEYGRLVPQHDRRASSKSPQWYGAYETAR